MWRIDGGAELFDGTLRAVVHLTGDGALPMLSAAVDAIGAELTTASISQVDHEPGVSCTVTYRAGLRWPDGSRSDETLVAATSHHGPPVGAAVLTTGDLQVGMWRHPFDPALPGLVDAVHGDRLATRLGHIGPGPWTCEILTY